MKIIISIILLVSLIISCENKLEFYKNSVEKENIYNIFIKSDSLTLDYPDSLFPKNISDLTFFKDHLYVLSFGANIKYPLIKFTTTGKYVKTISRHGMGPMEFQYNPYRICSNNKYLLTFSESFNSLFLIENDKIVKKTSIPPDSCLVSSVAFLDDNKILCTSKKWTYKINVPKKHIYILNDSLKIIDSFQDFTKDADLLSYASFAFIRCISRNGAKIATHYGYPPDINIFSYKNKKLKMDTVINNIPFTDFKYVANAEKLRKKYDDQKISPPEFLRSFSRLDFVYLDKNYILGKYYTFYNKEQVLDVHFFILRNGKLVIDEVFENRLSLAIRQNDMGLFLPIFYNDDNEILKVKIYFLTLNRKYLEKL